MSAIRIFTASALAAALATLVLAAPQQYELPDGFQDILDAPVQETFSCEGLPYG